MSVHYCKLLNPELCEDDMVSMFECHNNVRGGSKWLVDGMVEGLVWCGGGVRWLRWWYRVDVGCGGHGGLGERGN